MTPAALADLVRSVARDVLIDHGLDPAALPATVAVQRPRDPGHGDYATNVALQTAKKSGVAAQELAGWLARELAQRHEVRSAEVAGPGFVNLRLGAQAHGEIVAQVLAAGESFGTSQDLVCVLHQEIAARMNRNAGPALRDLVEAVGVDAARYALVRSCSASPSDIDLGLWSKRTDDNPVFAVQYAHARLASVARNAVDLGISSHDAQLSLLDHEREGELIRTLGDFPRIVTVAAQLCEPHRVAHYLEELVGAYHRFCDTCRILPQGEEQPGPHHAARLALCDATRQVLVNGLSLLGVSAPEQM